MKEVFLNKSMKFITKYNSSYKSEDLERIQYGLEGIYLTITKVVIILVLATIIGILKELLLVLLFFNIIRYPAFGVHADKSSVCLICSIILILGTTFLITKINIGFEAQVIISVISFINYLLFAPADTIKRPLTNAKKRKYRKLASCIIALIYIILSFLIKSELLSKVIITALIIEAIMINPVIYKMLKMPYANYKKIG